MTGSHPTWARVRCTVAALRFPWPKAHASLSRLVLLCLGASFAAVPRNTSLTEVAWRLLALQVCALSGFFATVLLNDITDREIDKIAHPERPLARGDVRVGDAVALCACLYVLTIAAAAALSTLLLGLVIFWLSTPVAAHYFFGKRGRGDKSSAVYSDLVTPLQFAGLGILVYLGFENYDALGMFQLASIIYCGDASMNVLQGIKDEEGDAAFLVSTIATSHGRAVAARWARVLHLGVLLVAINYAVWAQIPYYWVVGVTLLWVVVDRVVRTYRASLDEPQLSRAISATALSLQFVLISLGAFRLPELVKG